MILAGRKTWEMRSRTTSLRGRIGLIRKRSGLVVGTADLFDCMAPLNAAMMAATVDRHGIGPGWQEEALAAGWVIPWVLRDARSLATPVPYRHPSGAVGWVVLEPSVTEAIAGRTPAPPPGLAARPAEGVTAPPPRSSEVLNPAAPPGAPSPLVGFTPGGAAVVRLTGGNVRNGHIYLRTVRDLLPEDAIGGPNAEAAAPRPLTVVFDPGPTISTDIAGDKMILRQRGAVREFFQRTGAGEGDDVRIERVGTHTLRISLLRGPR
jgi:hypothetical protein